MGCVTFGCCNAYRIPLALGLDLKKEVVKTIEDWRVWEENKAFPGVDYFLCSQ